MGLLIFFLDISLDQPQHLCVVMDRCRPDPMMFRTQEHFETLTFRYLPARVPRKGVMFLDVLVDPVIVLQPPAEIACPILFLQNAPRV